MEKLTHQLNAFHEVVKITFCSAVEPDAAAGIHFTRLQFAGRFAMKGVQREIFLIHIHHLLAIVRVQMDESVLLKANEVERVLWLPPDDPQAVLRAQEQLQTMGIGQVQLVAAQPQWYKHNERLPVLLMLCPRHFCLWSLRLLPRHIRFWGRFRNTALILYILNVN